MDGRVAACSPVHQRPGLWGASMADDIYHVTMKDGVFTLSFVAPKQLLLNPDWENMVWDQTLRMAHEAGVMPVGPIHIEHEDHKPQTELREGESLTERIQRWNTSVGPTAFADQIKVTAQVQIGLQL